MTDDAPRQLRFPAVPRSWDALGILLLGVLVVGWPVFFGVAAAAILFTGCFISCGDPQPGYGIVVSLVTLAIAALPFGMVSLYQRGSDRRRKRVAVAMGVAAAAAVLVWANATSGGTLLGG
jgi:hypothetical protein